MKKLYIVIILVLLIVAYIFFEYEILRIIVASVFVVIALIPLVEFLSKIFDNTKRSKQKEIINQKRMLQFQDSIDKLLRRIEKERDNFEQLLDKNIEFKNPAHEKAIKIHSFELMKNELKSFREYNFKKRLIDRILKEIEKNIVLDTKDTKNLLKLLNKLENEIK